MSRIATSGKRSCDALALQCALRLIKARGHALLCYALAVPARLAMAWLCVAMIDALHSQ